MSFVDSGREEFGVEAGELDVELGRAALEIVHTSVMGSGEEQLLLGRVGVIAAVHQLEQPVERLLEVRSVAGVVVGQIDQAEFAEPVEAVAVDVVLVVGRDDAEFGTRLGVQQHDEPVQVAECLTGEVAGVDVGAGEELLVAFACSGVALGDHLVGDDLDALADAGAQLLGDTDGVLVRLVDQGLERRLPVDRHERVGGEERSDGLQLALGGRVVAVEGQAEIDGEESALGPLGAFGQEHDGATEDEHVARRLVGVVDLTDRIGCCVDGPLVDVAVDPVAKLARLIGAGVELAFVEVEQVVDRRSVAGFDRDEQQPG